MKFKRIINPDMVILIAISLAALFLRFIFRDFISRDMKYCLLPWYEKIAVMSAREALTTQVGDYNFLYQLLIYDLKLLPGDAIYKYKALSVFFDYILAFGVYHLVKDIAGKKQALIGYIITLLLPTVWLNSAVWGQCDSMYVSAILWSLYFLRREELISSFALLGLALAFKLQTVSVVPFYGYVYLEGVARKTGKLRLYHFGVSIVTMLLTAIPNVIMGRSISDFFSVYLKQTETYKEMTMNYPSIWNLLRLSYETDKLWCIGFAAVLLCVFMYVIYKKRVDTKRHCIWCAFTLAYTCVLFLPSMRERYGFLYEILAVVLAFSSGIGWVILLGLQLISMKTYFYYLYNMQLNMEFLSFLNICLYIFSLYAFYRELSGKGLRTLSLSQVKDINTWGVSESWNRVKALTIKRIDIKIILLLTAVFAIAGSMHLGTMKAPETSCIIGKGTEYGKEIYVSLDKSQDVHTLCIYPMMSKDIAFDLYCAEDGKWKKVEEETKLGGMFTWKEIKVDKKTHELCLIFREEAAEIGEIVCMDKKGKQIPLKKGNVPAAVFDEQDTLQVAPTGFDSMIFDEVYHGRTGYEFLHGLKIYENTHPPLGKIIISLGIAVFGMNPFGYRIMGFLFGVMCIPGMYLLALRITGKTSFATLAGVLQITEFMHYTLSRIATIDIFVAFFVLCIFYGMVAFLQEEKYRYLLFSGLAFAFGAATKWTALYAAPGIGLILLFWMIGKLLEKRSGKGFKAYELFVKPQGEDGMIYDKEKPDNGMDKLRPSGNNYAWVWRFILMGVVSFVLLPCIVYVLSYIPFARVYPEKNILQHAVENSVHILYYHNQAHASHPYASAWYTWLFDLVALIDFRTYLGEYKSVIATFANPVICWLGLLSVLHHVYLSFKKDVIAVVLLVFYLCMLLPWVFITRTVFIYQYFICTKVLILMICYSIYRLRLQEEKKAVKMIAGCSAFLFMMYFPVLSGVMVKASYINESLKFLPGWKF